MQTTTAKLFRVVVISSLWFAGSVTANETSEQQQVVGQVTSDVAVTDMTQDLIQELQQQLSNSIKQQASNALSQVKETIQQLMD